MGNIYKDCMTHSLCIVGKVYSIGGAIVFGIGTILAVAAPPLILVTIGMTVLCIVCARKVIKKDKIAQQNIAKWRAMYRRGSKNLSGETTYCFVSPTDYRTTLHMLKNVLTRIGEVNNIDTVHGAINSKLYVDYTQKIKVDYYVERSNERCKVRAVFHKLANDDWWDMVIVALSSEFSPRSIEISRAEGHPYIASVLYLGDDTQTVHRFNTKSSPSLGGFLVGGLLFGEAGAVVGGLSGKSRTYGVSRSQFSNSQLVRLIYSDGRLWEGEVRKGTQIYNEIMVNL